jgi:UDP-4-amino-4-deoxy-L-arabinose formyltransferase / UDP-glucuronic acid dehydrogenase (UDP-4-keto-hexauronic acid decarboxylating)
VKRARWAVFAYHTIGARALEALVARGEEVAAVVTHADDRAEGRWFESVADVARTHRIRCLTPSSPNVPEVVETLRGLDPDLILSVWYRRLLGAELLAVPRVAALNLHGSLLPAYRGRAPLNWVLVNGETRTGVTLHHMTLAADAGDIVAQRPISIDPDDTAFTLYERIVKVGVELLLETYPAVLANTAARIVQDHARATTVPRRRPEDGRIEWSWPAARIFNMVRAVADPYPGAFVGDGPARLRLWAASMLEGSAGGAAPGTVVRLVPARGLAVATGQGLLLITRVQSADGVAEPADCWAERRALRAGTRL